MKILVISPSWIGDTVLSHSLYRLLVKRYLKVKIHVIAPIYCHPILNRMPEVDKILFSPIVHGSFSLSEFYYFGKLLRIKKYHQAIVLPNSFKSALIPLFAKVPKRTGWVGEIRYGLLNDIRVLKKSLLPAMVQRYSALAYDKVSKKILLFNSNFRYLHINKLPWPYLSFQKEETINILKKFNLYKNKKLLIGLCPSSASGLSKCWPDYYFATLAINLIQNGYFVIILGLPHDSLIRDHINKRLSDEIFKKNCFNFIGKTTLDQAILLIASCSAIISNDSGLMHIACALKRPVIGLYGITNPKCTPPLSHKAIVIHHMSAEFSKIRRFKYNCFRNEYHQSLIDIKPVQVLEKLEILMADFIHKN